jgi:hypothetical protein
MADLVVGFLGRDTTRKPSDSIWKGCPWLELLHGGVQRSGFAMWDDFGDSTAPVTNGTVGRYTVIGTTGAGALTATDDGGVIRLATGAGASQEAYLGYGGATGGPVAIRNAGPNMLWFEARVRLQTVLAGGYFVGLMRSSDIASGMLVNVTTVLASTVKGFGFSIANATPTLFDAVFANGAAPTTFKAAAATMVVNTWVKLGMKYWGNIGPNVNAVQWFVNGVEVTNTAGTSFNQAVSAANFPSAQCLTPVFAAKSSGGTQTQMDVDWWRLAQIIEDPTFG